MLCINSLKDFLNLLYCSIIIIIINIFSQEATSPSGGFQADPE